MNSSDSTNPSISDSSVLLEMSPERFGMVFQVAKELPNVSDRVIESQKCTRADASDLLRIFRRARGGIGETTVGVRFRLASESCEEPVFASPVIEVMATTEDMTKWRRMLEAVCVSLGPEELFLRSGYREGEVREALNFLS
ncbi:hypothetical protein AB0F32_07900 [Streptomyces albidoflavus]|uniref:hypothetical protein n=1 Tax=Streptomyces TaxID=1883 RepID=UPI001183E2FE|nr:MULTISPECIES: hypothetical protein [Streptomyces]MEE1723802.1 hypothetical protein [Streptomyces sp. JV186]WTC30737.1 hypothetical protein OH749_16700 [Streptomyces albidoflavus]